MRKYYRDRHEAGRILAQKLSFLQGKPDVIVLGIPRGGVVVAYEVARALGVPLDVYITRKIGMPYNPEFAIGAVASDGTVYLERDLIRRFGVSERYVQEEIERQRREIERRMTKYRGDRPGPKLTDQTVVLVDDGVATGATTLATLRALRQQKPKELILAVPVGPPDAIAMLSQEADRVICPLTPEAFWAVGQFYAFFAQTTDEEVMNLLERGAEWSESEEARR
ncbi:MAG: phosphoribosyltransferase [Anaerolineae bacterium]|nr:phosphoribosyltransferase [Anaerolineae bacterium]